MRTINIHEAKTNLSILIEKAVCGEPFIIAKADKPLVKVSGLCPVGERRVKRLGFMNGFYEWADQRAGRFRPNGQRNDRTAF